MGWYPAVAFRLSTIASARRAILPLAVLTLCAVTLPGCTRESESQLPAAGLPIGASLQGARQPHYRGATKYRVVFSVSASGTENVLYDFSGPPDGSYPVAGLVAMDGTLYGTTSKGGLNPASCPYSGTCDWGTVFAFEP